jgi:hypothetical protein
VTAPWISPPGVTGNWNTLVKPAVACSDQQVFSLTASKPSVNADKQAEREGWAMAEQIHVALRHLEGRRVGLVLTDGSRIVDAQLISAGRPGLSSVWILIDGDDSFIPVMAVTEVWEIAPATPFQAA